MQKTESEGLGAFITRMLCDSENCQLSNRDSVIYMHGFRIRKLEVCNTTNEFPERPSTSNLIAEHISARL